MSPASNPLAATPDELLESLESPARAGWSPIMLLSSRAQYS